MTIHRLPSTHPSLGPLLTGCQEHLATLHPPPSDAFRRLRPDVSDMARQSVSATLLSSNLGDLLARHIGKRTMSGQGKYRKNEWFLFEFRSEIVLAITEKGNRGSNWFWLPREAAKGNGRSYEVDAPEVASFWPDFIVELMERVGRPIACVEDVFLPDALPCLRARVQAAALALADVLPSEAKASQKAPRL